MAYTHISVDKYSLGNWWYCMMCIANHLKHKCIYQIHYLSIAEQTWARSEFHNLIMYPVCKMLQQTWHVYVLAITFAVGIYCLALSFTPQSGVVFTGIQIQVRVITKSIWALQWQNLQQEKHCQSSLITYMGWCTLNIWRNMMNTIWLFEYLTLALLATSTYSAILYISKRVEARWYCESQFSVSWYFILFMKI